MDKGIEALIADYQQRIMRNCDDAGRVLVGAMGLQYILTALEQAQQTDGTAGMVEQYETALHIKDQRIAELEQWQQCEHSKKRNAVIDGLAQCGESGWEIEEYMQQWDKEHPLELTVYKAAQELSTPRLAPHLYRECVNELTTNAKKYANAGQLRERLSYILGKYIEADHPHTRTSGGTIEGSKQDDQ